MSAPGGFRGALRVLNIKVFTGIVNRNGLLCAGKAGTPLVRQLPTAALYDNTGQEIFGKKAARLPNTLLKNGHFAISV